MARKDDDIMKAANARALAKASAAKTPTDPLQAFLDYAKTRPAELDALLAKVGSNEDTVTNWRGTVTAEKGTTLYNTIVEQNKQRAARDAAYADKPTTDPGEGYYWGWQERNQKWVRIRATGFGGSSGGGGGGFYSGGNNNDSTKVTLVSTETDEYGNVIGIYSDGTTKTLIASGRKYKTTVDLDAYGILEQTFKNFGLEELVPEIQGYMERGLGSEQAALELRKSEVYTRRFRGNEIRRSAGLNVISEAEYLNLEDSYNETLRAYGLQGYFGVDKKAAQSKMADLIGNDIAATEFKDRIDTVVTRVNNADPTIKGTLKTFYNITDTDLVNYFLNPKENLPKLQEKVTAAEIGSAAIGQGLVTGVTSAEALAKLGVTRGKAVEGYGIIAETLPTAQKLAQVYGEEGIDYTQATAEEEVFKGMASAERKRKQLAAREFAAFGGASGVGRTSLGRGTSGAF